VIRFRKAETAEARNLDGFLEQPDRRLSMNKSIHRQPKAGE